MKSFQTKNKSYLTLGNKALREGDFVKAAECYEKLLHKESPLSESALFNMGLIEKRGFVKKNETKSIGNIDSIEQFQKIKPLTADNIDVGSIKWKQSNLVAVTENGSQITLDKQNCGVNQQTLDNMSKDELRQYYCLKNKNIDWSQYYQSNRHQFISQNPIIDYIKNWPDAKPLLPGFFDTSFYLESYPDIKNSGLMPLLHFIEHGANEGRQGILNPKLIQQGKLEYDPQKETIVFVTHESSATGAPLLGYCIADKLSEKYNIVHIVLKKANIHDVFLNNCDLILYDVMQSAYISSYYFLKQLLEKRSIKCVAINSVVGYQTMYAAYKLHVPIVFLIHEFAEYMRPFGTMIDVVLHSDFVITPAKIILYSIMKEFKRFANHKEVPANMCICPQGKLPYIPDSYGDDDGVEALYKKLKISNPDDVKIIVGSGWVQIRKGVDLFIAVARYIKKLYGGKCKFVWVGEGFDPDNDLAYSIYLDREIEFSGLEDDFVFLEHQKNLDNIFSIAEVFCLSSRMDPFPNVVIDALGHDLHVACFEHGSGSAEFLRKHHANSTIVDFVDTYEMAKEISKYLENGNDSKGINKEILKEHLDFDKYVTYIDELTDKAVAFKAQSKMMTEKLLESGLFDADYCAGEGDAQEKCRRYVEYGLKGIHFYNPKIGFSEIEWLEKHSKNNNSIVPLYEAMESKEIETHKVVTLPCDIKEKPNFNYAVHLHLYYIDMAPYFISYFKNLPHEYDLYITIVTKEAKEEVEKQFSDCGASMVKVVCVENIGRDLSPLLFGFKDEILNGQYDVVGHFHSKKSLDLESGGGDKWLEYLMQHLIGDKDNAQSVLSIFNDPSVGLVFPEDTNTSNIGENKEFVAHLCKMLDLPVIEQTPVFPMGNMFWARVEAIKDLFHLDADVVLQPEPLPYDGSYMHALERITPNLSQKNGFKYLTVYKKGMAWK